MCLSEHVSNSKKCIASYHHYELVNHNLLLSNPAILFAYLHASPTSWHINNDYDLIYDMTHRWVARQSSTNVSNGSAPNNQASSLHSLSFTLHRLSFLMLLAPPTPPSSALPASSTYSTPLLGPAAAPSSSSSSPFATPVRSISTPTVLASPAAAAPASGASINSTQQATPTTPLVQPSTPLSSSSSVAASPPMSPLPSPMMSPTMSPFLSPLMLPSMPSLHGVPSFSLSGTASHASSRPRAISFGPSSTSTGGVAVSSPARPILAGLAGRGSGVSLSAVATPTKDKEKDSNMNTSSIISNSPKRVVSPSEDTVADRMLRMRAAMAYAQRHFAPFATTHATGRIISLFDSLIHHSILI
jgi:hypothetical protein